MKDTILKKALSLLTAASCVAGLAMAVSATEAVEISETTFPDEVFRTYVSENIDKDSDGSLSEDEISAVKELLIYKKGIADLEGIGVFTGITRLECDSNKLTKLDLTKNTNLSYLNCGNNKIKTLDMTGLNLSHIECANNKLTALDLTSMTNLEHLECQDNSIASLDLSNNKNLNYVICYSNAFTELDISMIPQLVLCFTDGEPFEFGQPEAPVIRYAYKNYLISYSKSLKLTTGLADIDGITFDLDDAEKNKEEVRIRCGNEVESNVVGAGDAEVTWKSSDKSIASVNSEGLIKFKKAGLVTITAKCGDKEASRTIRVLFEDLTDETTFWYTPTYYLTDLGVVKGYNNQTKFKATNKCTRAQMVTFIWRLVGSPEPKTKKCKFTDVKESDYFYKACLWGNENHIVEGYSNNTFRPQVVCARRHAVTFLWRLAGQPDPTADKNKFIDISESDYYYKPTIWASELRILEGYPDDTFRPNGACLRRQMTTFLYKYDKFVNGKG